MKAPVRPVTVDVTPFPGGEQAAAVTWPDDRRMVYDWSALKPGSHADVMEPPWTVRNATRWTTSTTSLPTSGAPGRPGG